MAGVVALAAAAAISSFDPWDLMAKEAASALSKSVEVLDEAAYEMPSWYQGDPAWAGLRYAGGAVAGRGCGLCAAAMAASWWSRGDVTPADLISRYGDSCTVGGLNDMRAFADRLCADYGLERSGPYFDARRAVDEAMSGRTVFASLRGRFGDLWIGRGHIVLIWSDGGSLRVSDPASPANTRAWDPGELAGATTWKYFVSIGRS